MTTFEKWDPPKLDVDADEGALLGELDPRVEQHHVAGRPCPVNPPPPAGWKYLHPKGHVVTSKAVKLATDMLSDPEKYPMGTFVQTICDGELIGARVEWHNVQGATGKEGVFRGVNLMLPIEETL